MRTLPIVSPRRGPILVVVTIIMFFTAQAVPAFASVPKPQAKLTTRTSLRLRHHGSFYLYGLVSDGSASSSSLQDQLYSVQNGDGFTSAAIAEGPTTSNSYSTTTVDHELAGVRIPEGFNQIVDAGDNSNAGPGSSLTTSVTFSVGQTNTIIEVIGLGSSQQTSSLHGVPGLTRQKSSNVEAVQVADAYNLTPGSYTVTLDTSQTAPGQDPNRAADLLAVFEFHQE